jgi:hypothetical protein
LLVSEALFWESFIMFMSCVVGYSLLLCRSSPDVDAVTYDVIGNQGPEYEVIKKGKAKSPPTSAREGKEFTLSKCAAYGPVSTPGTQGEQTNQSAEYELVQTTSNM